MNPPEKEEKTIREISNDDVRKGIGDEYIFTDRWTQTDEIL